jgi:enoyl-CoA hydratase/carnithine racemase
MEASPMENILVENSGKVCTVIINRPGARNAVNRPTAEELFAAFKEFDADDSLYSAVLCGAEGYFCAGADLKALASGDLNLINPLNDDMSMCAPMGPTRLLLSKPVIAAVAGYAVAGGLELACWCDMRVVEEDAVFGVFDRRWAVPLMDGGTQRLPRLIGMSRALDMILTGRAVGADEALAFGLANRVVGKGEARREAEKLASELAEFPQSGLRGDRRAAYLGFGMEFDRAMELEYRVGIEAITSGEAVEGATDFAGGKGKHGEF